MKVSDLNPNPKNPRIVTDEKLSMLKKTVIEFGDLSGIVFNRKTKRLVGGHQRTKLNDEDTPVEITKKYSKPTKTGTVAEGFILLEGERFTYREVQWSEQREKAANIAANKGAGEWDLPQLSDWMKDLSSFDADFDMDLTGFDEDERQDFFKVASSSDDESENQKRATSKSRLEHTCPECGCKFTNNEE